MIRFYNVNGHTHEWGGTLPMTIDMNNILLANVVKKITNSINQLFNFIQPEWSEIVKWNTGCQQKSHYDTTIDNIVFTSVTYLNNDYEGGHTYFKDDIEVIPKVGRTVFFDGKYYLHGVTQVTSGTRYTLPIWYNKRDTLNLMSL